MSTAGAPEPSSANLTDPWGSLQPDDVRVAASLCHDALAPLVDADWSCLAHGLEWDCQRTLWHLIGAVDVYSLQLATPSERFRSPGAQYPTITIADLLPFVQRRAAVLALIASTSDPSLRGNHFFGPCDPPGYIAMGCAEILLHTDDIILGLRVAGAGSAQAPFRPPDALCERVARRLYPWVPTDVGGWEALRWASGRAELPGYGPGPTNWAYHAPPVAEWDGTPKSIESYLSGR
jgi:hypothetical protein